MKQLLLSLTLALFSFASFASNKICIGEKVIVVFNENIKKLTVHDKESLELLQSTELEGNTFGEIALSKNGTKIWFQMDGVMYCRDVDNGEILKEIQGANSYKFELSAAQDYLIHFERIEESSLIYVYDLNTAEAISYAKVDFTFFLETIHYDHEKQQLHLLSKTFPSETEKPSKEPVFGLPETAEQIALDFRHDEEESRYYVYDIENKKVLYDKNIAYSPDFSCDFEVINERLYIITQMGTAEVLDDYSLKLTSLVLINMNDYAILESEMVGATNFFLFSHSFETGAYKEWDDDEVNLIIVEADAIAMTETEYYCILEGLLYRFDRSDPSDSNFDMPLD